ncbi:MAG TPA: DUF4350 domain-containing protein [Chryseolinea sp.]|nr:DUF4350 domain-containing protein [Chryseolinea sp.]
MTRDWKYILYISLAFGAFLMVKLLSPKQYNWTITYAAEDKNPFGGYALRALMSTHFSSDTMRHSFKTLYELRDSLKENANIFVLAQSFSPGEEDTDALLDHVYKGGNAFLSSNYLDGPLADTLKLRVYSGAFRDLLQSQDSSKLHLVATSLDTMRSYSFKEATIESYFRNFDTTRTTVIAVNEQRAPVTIRMKWGAGNLIFNSTPLIFTNMYLLAAENADFVSTQLSYLPNRELTWTEFYQRGRREISTPLRYVLLNEPLSWAYYITVVTLLVFMLFEMKRRQRIIPVIPPLANTTLDFVSTIGDLYYQRGDHKNIAEKKIAYFLEQVRSRHALVTSQLDGEFATALSRKSGREEKEMAELVLLIRAIKDNPALSAETLVDLNTKLEAFYSKG